MNVRLTVFVSLVCSTVVVGGCQTQRLSLSKESLYFMDKVPSEAVEILWADVYEREGLVTVEGVFRKRGYSSGPLKTHIDVQVLSLDGQLLHGARTKDMDVPRRRVGKGVDWKRFTIILPEQPPANAKIRLICHAGAHVQATP